MHMSKRRPTKKLYTDHNMHTHTHKAGELLFMCVLMIVKRRGGVKEEIFFV